MADKADKVIKLDPQGIQKQCVRVAVTRADFRAEYPRFYQTFDVIDQIVDADLSTMAVAPIYDGNTKQLTGKYKFLWSPNFASEISDQQLIGVQMHELLHILLGHTTNRMPDLKSFKVNDRGDAELRDLQDRAKHELWNIATDLAINGMIKKWLKDPKGDPDLGLIPGEGHYKQYPVGLNAEQYYERLLQDNKDKLDNAQKLQDFLKQLGKALKDAGAGSHDQWLEADGDGNVTEEPSAADKKGKHMGTPRGEEGDEELPGDSPSPDENKDAVDQIAKDLGLDKWAGTSSATSSKYVDLSKGREIKTPGWMKKTTHASTHGYEITPQLTRKVPNRRFGMLFPGKRRKSSRNKVAVFVDVSGSISRPQLNKFTHHLNNMERFADFDLWFFNHAILDKQGKAYDPSQAELAKTRWKKGMDFYVGGGTDFEPIFKFWNRVRVKYDALFIFTDGEAGYQTPPVRPKEVNWILYNASDWYTGNLRHGNKYPMDKTTKVGKYEASDEVVESAN